MFSRSYKYYLNLLERSSKTSPPKRIILAIAAVIFVLIGISSALVYYLYQKEAPIRAQNQYLQLASGGFNSVGQSLNEILSSLQVAGAKTEIIDKSKESSPSAAGYFVSLDDIQKIMSSLEKINSSVSFQKKVLSEKNPPEKYSKLHGNLLNFYDQTEKLVSELSADQQFLKDMFLAVGPNFYLPVLTYEDLWKDGKKDEIISYLDKTKTFADGTLANLAKLSVPEKFRPFYEAQMGYLELVVKVAVNITSTLKESEDTRQDSVTQLEKAYQILVGAKRDNEKYSQKLTDEKLKIFDLKKNLEKFSGVKLAQTSLEAELGDSLSNQEPVKFGKLPIYLRKFKLSTL